MPTVSYFLSTSDCPINGDHPLWHRPLPDNRSSGSKESETVGADAVTYGQYFLAVSNFCETDGWERILKAASRQLHRPVDRKDLGRLSIFLEKHGAFYHPARLEVTVEGQTLSYVVNVAASSHGRRAISREVNALERLNNQRPFGWFPQVYGCASDGLPMFLGEWFDGFHEFHLTRLSESDEPGIVVWDGAAVPCLLSETQAAVLYRDAAMILTACYDPVSSCQIFPWHHAAGDFVVRVDEEQVNVRLITVRDYGPMAGAIPETTSERSILDTMVIFFLHLSLRMRLDRIDGVKEVAWASERFLAPMVDGFFLGLDLTARMSGFPENFPDTFRHFFNHHNRTFLLSTARYIAETVFDQRTEEYRLIDCHLAGHVQGLQRLLGV